MFKQQRQKRKTDQKIISEHLNDKQSNFKSGSIEISTDQLFFHKINKLNEITSIPLPGQQFRIVTQKAVNSFDFILAILHDETIEELICAFYRIGKKVIQEIKDLQEKGNIQHVHFLVNDAIPKLTPDCYNLLKSLETDKFVLRLENNHTKIILIKTNLGNHYIIEGSGNLSINARIEQYSFDNNKELFDFHKNWIINL